MRTTTTPLLFVPIKPAGKPLFWHLLDPESLFLTRCKKWVPKAMTTYHGPTLPAPACPVCVPPTEEPPDA